MNRVLCSLLVLGFLIFSLAYVGAADRVRFGTPVKMNPLYNLPPMAAEEKGFWKQNNLEAEWVSFSAGGALAQALAAGAVDLAITTTTSVIETISKGVPLLIVADMQVVDDYVVWVRTDSLLRDPKELKGLKIGTARFGGTSYAFGRAVFKALGLEKDIKWVSTGGTTQTMAALKVGVVDASIWARFTGLPLKARGEIRDFISIRDYLPKEWSDVVLYGRKEFFQRNPDLTRRAVKAVFQAAQYVVTNRDWTSEKLRSEFGYSDAAIKLALNEFRYGKGPKMDIKGLENVRKFLIEFDIVPGDKTPPVEELFTSKFTE